MNMNNTTTGKQIAQGYGVPYIVSIITLNGLLSVTATLFNFFIILTFIKTPSLRSPSNILILNLAVTDFGIGAVVQPAYCASWLGVLTDNVVLDITAQKVYLIVGNTLFRASYCTITAITLDRFLAVYLHLRYKEVVTTKRTTLALIPVWLISISWFVVFNIFGEDAIADAISQTLEYSTLALNIVLMLKISRVVRKHAKHIQAQTIQENRGEIVNMKKSVNIMYCIVGVFFVCYFPAFCIWLIYRAMRLRNVAFIRAGHAIQTILFANSSINPVIYFWRIKDMRNATAKLLQCMGQQQHRLQQRHDKDNSSPTVVLTTAL